MIDGVVRWALRNGVRKGVAGGSGPWLVVAVAAGAVRLAKRPPRGQKSAVLQLKPGEQYSITCRTDG